MTTALRLARRRGVAAVMATGLLLAWLPAAAWADARTISDDLCQAPYDTAFDDIAGSAHEENILCMADHDLTEGVGDGTSYGPRRDVTRGQMASFIARFLQAYTGDLLPEGDAGRFDDVPADDEDYPHATSIHSLAEIEVVDGTAASGGDQYAPQARVTRAQMASMIRRALAWADDGDARNDSAPPAVDARAFADTAGSVHEANIDAIAAEGIVQGFGDDTYRPGEVVKRDQMASFVMRSYDYALEVSLGRDDDGDDGDDQGDDGDDGGDGDDGDDQGDQPEGLELISPTTENPQFPVTPGSEIEVEFTTEYAGFYRLVYRDPDAGGGSWFPFLPGDEGDWEDFEGDDRTGIVEAGSHSVTVTLPSSDDEEGVRDLQLRFHPGGEEDDQELTRTEDAALIVSDGIAVNLDAGTVHFDLQDAVDEASDGDTLLAIGHFQETVVVSDLRDVMISGTGETELSGSFEIEGDVEGLTLSDIEISDYTSFDGSPLGIIDPGEPIGILVRDGAEDLTLTDLALFGADDGTGVAIEADASGVTLRSSALQGHDVAVVVGGDDVTIGEGNTFEDNSRGVLVESSADDAVVVGNDFDDHSIAVVVTDASGVTVTANDFVDTGEAVRGNGSDLTVTDNRFEGYASNTNPALRLNRAGAAVEDNEFVDTDGEHVRITNSHYADHAGFAVDLIAANDFEVDATHVVDDDHTLVVPRDAED